MNRKILFMIGLLFFASVFILFLNRHNSAAIVSGQDQPETAPTRMQIKDETEALIEKYEALLQEDGLDPEAQKSIEEKLTMAQRMNSIQEQAAAPELSDIESVMTPVEQDNPMFQPGIYEGGEGIFRASEAVISNYWQGLVDGSYVQVFAGVSGADTTQGVIYVITTSQDRLQIEIEQYFTPWKEGSVRIISETNLVLRLENQVGFVFFFDLPTREFNQSFAGGER